MKLEVNWTSLLASFWVLWFLPGLIKRILEIEPYSRSNLVAIRQVTTNVRLIAHRPRMEIPGRVAGFSPNSREWGREWTDPNQLSKSDFR